MFDNVHKFFGKNRIRKQFGDISIADWESFPAWEFCLDEEGIEGQDETTMRPIVGATVVRYPDFFGLVACSFQPASGETYTGLVEPGEAFEDGWKCSPQLLVPNPVPVNTGNTNTDMWNQLFSGGGDAVSFFVPAMSDEECRPYIELAYRVLNTSAEKFWPLRISPRVRIKDYPESWEIDGWLVWRDIGGKRRVIR